MSRRSCARAALDPERKDTMASAYFAPPLPRIFAHRGLSIGVPENTVASFTAAVVAGAEYLETDAHVTADGIAVLSHDPVVHAGGEPVEIRSVSAERLGALDLGGGSSVPRLDDILLTFPERRFNIDVKVPGAVDAVASAVRAAGAEERVLVTSFDGATRRAVAAAVPGAASSASRDLIALALLPAHLGWAGAVRRILSGVACVQIPERHRAVRLVTRRTIRTFHAAGIEVHVWTVNDPSDMVRLVAMGVDGIVTDRCDVAARALGAVGPS